MTPQPENPVTQITPRLERNLTKDGAPSFTMIPNWVIEDNVLTRLDGSSLKVYLVRLRYTFDGKPLLWSQARIAKKTGFSQRSVNRADKLLVDLGLTKRGKSYKVGERGKGVWVVWHPKGSVPNMAYNRKSGDEVPATPEKVPALPEMMPATPEKVPASSHNKDSSRLLKTNQQEEEKRLVGPLKPTNIKKAQAAKVVIKNFKFKAPNAKPPTLDEVYLLLQAYGSWQLNKIIEQNCDKHTKGWGAVTYNLKEKKCLAEENQPMAESAFSIVEAIREGRNPAELAIA